MTFENRKITLPDNTAGFAWDRDTLLEFLNDPSAREFVILGGDIYKKIGPKLEITYDNWSINSRQPGESFEKYCERSRFKAIDYVTRYPLGKEFLFAPVITSEITAGL